MATTTGKVQPRRIKVLENKKPVLRTKKRSQDTCLHRQKSLAMSASYCVYIRNQHAEEKMKSRKVLLAILGYIRYLARQALPLRGNWNLETGSEEN